jgi:hypothetical protein
MRKLIPTLFVASLLFVTHSIKAQYVEIGAITGGTSYVGDLQKFKPELGSFGPTVSLMARWNRSPRLAFRATALYGSFNATDYRAFGTLHDRNLEVQTKLYELAVCAEYNVMPFDVMDGKTSSPYLFVGVGGLYFNPQARYEGKFIDLRPLGTEGQLLEGGKTYSPFQVVIPMGIGVKLALGQRLSVGFEFGVRQTFTDYLDDVSGNYPNIDVLSNVEGKKRGDNTKMDYYYFTGMSVTYSLASPKKMEYNTSYRNFFNF